MLHRESEFAESFHEWAKRILVAMVNEFSYGVPGLYTSALFSNERERFLAIYDNERAYVELFGESGGCFGYDRKRNRWAYGEGPDKPLVVKKDLRPWIESRDTLSRNLGTSPAR